MKCSMLVYYFISSICWHNVGNLGQCNKDILSEQKNTSLHTIPKIQ